MGSTNVVALHTQRSPAAAAGTAGSSRVLVCPYPHRRLRTSPTGAPYSRPRQHGAATVRAQLIEALLKWYWSSSAAATTESSSPLTMKYNLPPVRAAPQTWQEGSWRPLAGCTVCLCPHVWTPASSVRISRATLGSLAPRLSEMPIMRLQRGFCSPMVEDKPGLKNLSALRVEVLGSGWSQLDG
jgi:hypothetical protein